MAMIKCTECGNSISDKASNCPHCGCPMEEIKQALAEIDSAVAEKKKEKPKKEKKLIPPVKKKKYIIIGSITIFAIIVCAVFAWYFGIKVPRDNVYTDYLNIMAEHNTEVDVYNGYVASFNEKANQIISLNDEYTNVIDASQAIINSGDIPYEAEKMTTLSNTLKNARNNKVETPMLYENISQLSFSPYAPANASAKGIITDCGVMRGALASIKTQNSEIETAISELIVPDYSETIKKIINEQKLLEDSYSIQKQITNPTQDFVLEKLNNVANIANVACATEENDPNGHLGKAGGYTAQIWFSSPLLGTETLAGDRLIDAGTDSGGSIEVYTTIEEAEKRNAYLAALDGGIFDSGKHVILGTMIVRVSTNLTASKQDSFTNEIIAALIEQ